MQVRVNDKGSVAAARQQETVFKHQGMTVLGLAIVAIASTELETSTAISNHVEHALLAVVWASNVKTILVGRHVCGVRRSSSHRPVSSSDGWSKAEFSQTLPGV